MNQFLDASSSALLAGWRLAVFCLSITGTAAHCNLRRVSGTFQPCWLFPFAAPLHHHEFWVLVSPPPVSRIRVRGRGAPSESAPRNSPSQGAALRADSSLLSRHYLLSESSSRHPDRVSHHGSRKGELLPHWGQGAQSRLRGSQWPRAPCWPLGGPNIGASSIPAGA